MRIILIGFMGSGKSTLGKKLAARLQLPFIDTDLEIEKHYGMSIAELFVAHGESKFREMEAQFVSSLDPEASFVLASGGGTPCFGNNMDLLNEMGLTIYLKRSAAELANRLVHAKHQRPLISGLTEAELLEFIEHTLQHREPYYLKSQLILERSEQQLPFILGMLEHLHPPQKN